MRKMWVAVAVAVALSCLAGPLAQARDLWEPPWDPTLPNQTSQMWEFIVNPGPEPTWADNPYGMPELQVIEGTYPDVVEGPEGELIPTWHIGPGGGVDIIVPNNPDPNLLKIIFWQVTSDKAPAPGGPVTNPPGVTQPSPHPQIQWPNGTWYTYNGIVEIPCNPPMEVIHFDFPESTNIEEIVIKTICIPEPASLLLLCVGAAGLAVRKRR